MNRIQRLVGAQPQQANRFTGLVASIIALIAVVSVGVGAQILLPPSNMGGSNTGRQTVNEILLKGEQLNSSETLLKGEQWQSGRESLLGASRELFGKQAAGAPGQTVNLQVAAAESMQTLNSTNPAERAAAACSLGRLGVVEAIPALINMLGDDTPIQPVKCWDSGNWSPARHTFKQSSPGEQAAIALASLGQPAVEPLIAALSNGNSSVRRNAAWAIGEIRGGRGTDRSAAVEPLIAALSDDDAWVRMAATFSLGEMRPREATESIIAALGDAEWSMRDMAAWALGEMKARSGVESLTALLLRDENERVRHKAAWALGEIRDPRALDALNVALNDQDQRVRATAKWAISEIRD